MNIHFLGTGTSQAVPVIGCQCKVCQSTDPKDHRLRSSVYITHNDQTILIDISPDFRQQMLTAKKDDVDAILLTHEHADHIGGLDDIRPINFKWKKNIPIYGMERTLNNVKSMFHYAFSDTPYPGVPRIDLSVIHRDTAFTINDLVVEALSVDHGRLPILAYKIGGFVYITDASHIPSSTLAKISNCDTLVINALRQTKHPSHFTLEEALKHIEIIQPRRAYITHISHLMGHYEVTSANLPQNVYLAYDGLSLDVQ